MNPFSNKIFAVETVQVIQSACEQSLTYERLIMGAFFRFPTEFGRTNQSPSLDGLKYKFGGIIMSNESKRAKPDCPLIGENGNIYNLVGIASRTLKRNGLSDEASEMSEKVFGSGSYEEALGIIGEYVNITSVNEPSEDMDMRMG